MSRWTVALFAAAAVAAAWPAPALGHGLVGRADLPVPRWLFTWAAVVVLLVSFAALATLWPQPRLQEPRLRRVGRVPVAADVACGAVGVLIFAILVYSGLAGAQTPSTNLAPTFVYVVFWVALPVASVLFGDVFRAFSPWRAVARAVRFGAARLSRSPPPAPLDYPRRLGYWPAAAGVAAFVWVELVYARGDDPSTLAGLALAYAALQLLGMSFYGIDRWSERGDAFGAYFNLFSRLSPWERRDGVLYLRAPLSGVPSLPLLPGTVALLSVAIGSTSFDGFSQTAPWQSLVTGLTPAFAGLGLRQDGAFQLALSVGLAGSILFIAALYRLGVQGIRTVDSRSSASQLSGRFVHTLVPIAFAYLLAHYFSLLAYQGQATAFLISDPLGRGANLFGTASARIDYNLITATGIWYVQVGALVVGHVCGLVLAHDRAIAVYRQAREATRSQYWMLLVMVAFTTLGLWLLSAINS